MTNCAVTRMRLPALRTLPSRMFATPNVSAIRRMSVFCPLNAKAEVRAITLKPGTCASAVQNLFGQPVAEVFVLLVAAHVGERQHGDGRSVSLAGFTPACSNAALTSVIV